ncbi:hypothetical protein [Polaromonas hydrogenivorans]|uniref:Uncharacterized protein n=1 Tax=Polaromonas hydrogenivorans TaxID=335476 RepID=A0AAU7LZX1_9BURK
MDFILSVAAARALAMSWLASLADAPFMRHTGTPLLAARASLPRLASESGKQPLADLPGQRFEQLVLPAAPAVIAMNRLKPRR